MYDSELLLRDGSTDLTATETGSAVEIGDFKDMTFRLVVPAIADAADTLDVAVQYSDDGSTWTELFAFPQITGASGAPTVMRRTLSLGGHTYVRGVFTVTTVAGSPNFGKVVLGPEYGGEYDNL